MDLRAVFEPIILLKEDASLSHGATSRLEMNE